MPDPALPQVDAPVARARALLAAAEVTPAEALSLSRELMKVRAFSWAGEVLRRAALHPDADAATRRTLGVKRDPTRGHRGTRRSRAERRLVGAGHARRGALRRRGVRRGQGVRGPGEGAAGRGPLADGVDAQAVRVARDGAAG